MEGAAVRFELVDINEILKTLPHRYPMLLIDRVIKIRTDYSGIGIKNVTFNEPPFLGHFPDRPVYPGVMMIEAMAQTAGVIGKKRDMWWFHGDAKVNGKVVAEADVGAMLTD